MNKILNNSTVKVNYVGKLENGEIFDSSIEEGREPLVTTLGKRQLIPGFESGLIDMAVGEKKIIEIEPKDGYGEIKEAMIVEIPSDKVPPESKVGDMLQSMTPNGPLNVKIIDITDGIVKIDANHPLAGKKLIFEVEILEIS